MMTTSDLRLTDWREEDLDRREGKVHGSGGGDSIKIVLCTPQCSLHIKGVSNM